MNARLNPTARKADNTANLITEISCGIYLTLASGRRGSLPGNAMKPQLKAHHSIFPVDARKTNSMNQPMRKRATTLPAPVLPSAIPRPNAPSEVTAPNSKPLKRELSFPKSRNAREESGTRQMKSAHNAKAFPHVR